MKNRFVLFLLAFCLTFAAAAQVPTHFDHVLIVVQENRTPDNLFQALCGSNHQLCPAPYNIQDYGIDKSGAKVPLVEVPLNVTFDLGHQHAAFVRTCHVDPLTNACRMDRAQKTDRRCAATKCSFGYVRAADVAPYVTMAQQYGFANYMFQSNQGPSAPAHAFLFSGTSAANQADDAAGIYIADNPASPKGCVATLDSVYWMISPTSAPALYKVLNSTPGQFCFSHPTLATLLENHAPALTWKYYTPGPYNIITAPNWIRQICEPDETYTRCTGANWKTNVDMKPPDVLKDIQNCALPNVSWVVPSAQYSDHASGNNGSGPSWVASIVNTLGSSSCAYWKNTAIIVTWDDWGGWYDHEPPDLISDYQYGFRVPLLFISAYTPAGAVSNERMDFGSILRFVEQNWCIEEGALNVADRRATENLTSFVNFAQQPRVFEPIPAPLPVDYFLTGQLVLEDPDDD
jgi:phospholipase C